MITTFVFKIYPKIYIDTIDTYMYLLSCPVTCGHFLRPFPLQGTLYQCSFYWHWHDCLYWHQSQFTILCNNQTPNQILHLYSSDRYQQPKLRLKLVWIQNQGKQGSMLRLLSHQCWSFEFSKLYMATFNTCKYKTSPLPLPILNVWPRQHED